MSPSAEGGEVAHGTACLVGYHTDYHRLVTKYGSIRDRSLIMAREGYKMGNTRSLTCVYHP